jgi:hypothetical protein
MKTWKVELAVCWPNGTWEKQVVDLDEGDFVNLDENGPTEGEIWEAAADRCQTQVPVTAPEVTAFGLVSYEAHTQMEAEP